MKDNSIQIGKLRMELIECSKFGPKFEEKIKQGFIWTVEITLMRGSKRYRFFYDRASGNAFLKKKKDEVVKKMKGNDGTGNIEERDDWKTPQWLFDKLNNQYVFTFDCCADAINKKCRSWHDNFLKVGGEEAGLDELDVCWMNPPFSNATKMFEHFFKVVASGVAIYRCDNLETKIWQNIIMKHATWILIPNKRICYEGKAGKGARFASALIGFNIEAPKDIEGTTLYLKSKESLK